MWVNDIADGIQVHMRPVSTNPALIQQNGT